MKTTTKFLIPLAFAMAAATAHASVFNIDYPAEQMRATGALDASNGAMVGIGAAPRMLHNNAPRQSRKFNVPAPTREDVLDRLEEEPFDFDDTRYFQ